MLSSSSEHVKTHCMVDKPGLGDSLLCSSRVSFLGKLGGNDVTDFLVSSFDCIKAAVVSLSEAAGALPVFFSKSTLSRRIFVSFSTSLRFRKISLKTSCMAFSYFILFCLLSFSHLCRRSLQNTHAATKKQTLTQPTFGAMM